MKGFRKLIIAVIICMVTIAAVANLILIQSIKGDVGRPYRVESERMAYDIEHGLQINLSKYNNIITVQKLDGEIGNSDEETENFFDVDNDYLIKLVNGSLYRFEYKTESRKELSKDVLILNVCMGVIFLFVILILIYIGERIIKPFDRMKDIPAELSKGNITVPLKVEKTGYFGNFIWGLNLLRERLEKGKQQDLEIQKNNKSLILSISHDIKTPIGIIELNAKALERGLYENNKEKKDRIAVTIKEKCHEINAYVDQIIKASREDFLELEVDNTEFYLSQAMNDIEKVYTEKLELLDIDFNLEKYNDCLIKGDPDRTVEVLQNLIENAIKYGDRKEICISFMREENSLLVSVSNTGCTLDDTELPHIFDSFWRGSNTGSNSGSGLGLYICKQLMNRMNGDIFAKIEAGKMIVTAVFALA